MVKFFKIIFFLFSLFFFSCNIQKNENIKGERYVKLFNAVSESVKGLSFKSLEAKGAVEVFEEYKVLKLKVIQNKFLDQPNDLEIKKLDEVRWIFNTMTMDADILDDIKNNYRENPYIREFENIFVEQLIKTAEPDIIFNISDLKIIYEN
jgi:hypothetical protein